MKSAEFIGWALGGLEREIAQTRQRLAALTEQAARLRQRVGVRATRSMAESSNAGTDSAPPSRKRRRRRMSPEARKRISEMMKKRWAERRRKNA